MNLTYAELEDFLAEIHDVAPEKRTALKGRLKHFQRLSWPVGTNLGKGARVKYGVGQTMLLAMGMEMLQLGLTPEKIVGEMKHAGGILASGISNALSHYEDDAHIVYLIMAPENLRSLQGVKDHGKVSSFQVLATRDEIQSILETSFIGTSPRLSLINVTNILFCYISYFSDKGLDSPSALKKPIERWIELENKAIDRRGSKLIEMLDGNPKA